MGSVVVSDGRGGGRSPQCDLSDRRRHGAGARGDAADRERVRSDGFRAGAARRTRRHPFGQQPRDRLRGERHGPGGGRENRQRNGRTGSCGRAARVDDDKGRAAGDGDGNRRHEFAAARHAGGILRPLRRALRLCDGPRRSAAERDRRALRRRHGPARRGVSRGRNVARCLSRPRLRDRPVARRGRCCGAGTAADRAGRRSSAACLRARGLSALRRAAGARPALG